MVGALHELRIGDDPDAWRAAGFSVADEHFEVDGVVVRLDGTGRRRGLLGWCLEGIDTGLDGLAHERPGPPARVPQPEHPNMIVEIDHVVVETNDFDRTVPALERAGLAERRTRSFEVAGSVRRQSFFWVGSVILELVGPDVAEPVGDPLSWFWGLAFTSADLDATVSGLGELASPPRDAVQRGRRITTLRTEELDISVPIAIMSPHP